MSPNIEPELLGPLPRATRRRYGFVLQVLIAIIIALPTLIGLALAVDAFDDIVRELSSSTVAVPSSGVVYGESNRGLLLSAVFWNSCTLIIIWQFFIAPLRQRQLVRYGTPVVGRITGRHTSGMGKNARYLIEYEYADDSGTVLTGKMSLRAEDWDRAYMFAPVTVLYDPKRPRRNVIYQFTPYAAH